MSYKGNDLDLRTPYAPGEDTGGLATLSSLPEVGPEVAPQMGRDGPIPVDPTVLACCNAAYDAAVFHGTRDVRLEHLLYALTRVEAAREILEQHGVRTPQLRRDTAAAIAAEAPAAGQGNRAPRATAELENLLRRAAGRAGQDSVPASVHDLMRAVLGYGREAPGTALLLRSASDPQQLERWAAETKPMQISHPAPALQPVLAQELMTRFDTLETAVRSLAGEVAADRKAMLEMMGEIQYELRATRQENATPPAIVLDKIDDVGRSLTGLSDRFEAARALAPPTDTVETRLSALESQLTKQPAAIANAIAYMLDERRAAEPEPLQLTATESPSAELTEKLTSLEALMRSQWDRIEEGSKVHERDLNELFEALVKLGSNQQTLASNLESWRLDNSGDVSIVSNRLKNLEQTLHEIVAPPSREGEPDETGRPGSFKRWLYNTASVLPTTWRPDPDAVRETVRSARDSEKT